MGNAGHAWRPVWYRCSEILGLRWQNVGTKNNTIDVVEQLPFHVPPKTTVIEEMAPSKSNGRTLPITELARPFLEKQLALLESQREAAQTAGKPYYNNDLVVYKVNVTACYVDVRLERKKEALDAYHGAIHPQPKQLNEQKEGRQKASRKKQKRSAEIGR